MDAERIPAEAFPLAEFLGDEMIARGWNTDDVAGRMGGTVEDCAKNMLLIMLLLSVQSPTMAISEQTFSQLGKAFDVDSEYFRRLDAAWHSAPADRRNTYSPPERLFGPVSRRGFIRAV